MFLDLKESEHTLLRNNLDILYNKKDVLPPTWECSSSEKYSDEVDAEPYRFLTVIFLSSPSLFKK